MKRVFICFIIARGGLGEGIMRHDLPLLLSKDVTCPSLFHRSGHHSQRIETLSHQSPFKSVYFVKIKKNIVKNIINKSKI